MIKQVPLRGMNTLSVQNVEKVRSCQRLALSAKPALLCIQRHCMHTIIDAHRPSHMQACLCRHKPLMYHTHANFAISSCAAPGT